MGAAKRKAELDKPSTPKVGIFWAVRGKLIVVGIPISEGKGYGEYVIYEPSHYDKWRELQMSGVAPRDCEYEEFPRGRVMFNRIADTYLLLADRCILGDKQMLNCLFQEMKLPRGTTMMGTDSHYRYYRCLGFTSA